MTTTWARMEALAVNECMRLLTDKPVGRVAFCGPSGPQVLPVNHAVVDGNVVFRVAAHSEMAQALNGSTVAFQVDDIDDITQSGWSVLVVGSSEYVEDPEAMTERWGRRLPDAWAPGVRTLVVRVVTSRVSGRRIHPA
jgi:nitroimidazol reductase NimA-like FMN-containing flavoprotein (pyridoxamine 5'-phosphate oxidase superfamily)